jgi:hypothetical protein
MNWEAIGAIAELAGAIGVVATLGYLAVQIRLSSEQAKSATELEATGHLAQISRRIAADSNLKRIYEEISANEALSPEDEIEWAWLLSEFFHLGQGVFFQYQRGVLSAEVWSVYERALIGFLEPEAGRRWWGDRIAPFSDSFHDHIDKAIGNAGGWKMSSIAQPATGQD